MGSSHHAGGAVALPRGLAMAVQTGPHDVQDGDDEQDSAGHVGADENGGEDGGHDVEGRRGVMDERGEEGGDGAGEGAEHEGGEAKCPDMCAGLSVGHVSLPWFVCPVRGVTVHASPGDAGPHRQ